MAKMGEWSTVDGKEEYISTVDGGGREKGGGGCGRNKGMV